MLTTSLNIIRYNNGQKAALIDQVICEEWMNLYYNNKPIYQTPLLNRDTDDLIHGVLATMGHIKLGDNLKISKKGDDYFVTGPDTNQGQSIRKQTEAALKTESSTDQQLLHPKSFQLDIKQIQSLMDEFNALPSVYHETGGAHMAALASREILHWADDVSRRNSIDKVIGKGVRAKIDFEQVILISSGRMSSDIIMRMIKCGIPIIVSVSAPMDKAVHLADKHNITICGFARNSRLNLYTHPERVSRT